MDNIEILTGSEGIKRAYEQVLSGEPLDIICLANQYAEVVGDWFDEDYGQRLYQKALTREILPDTAENRAFAKTKEAKKNQVKFMPKGLRLGETDLVVSDSCLMFVSFNPAGPMAVIIKDKDLIRSAQAQFEALWQRI